MIYDASQRGRTGALRHKTELSIFLYCGNGLSSFWIVRTKHITTKLTDRCLGDCYLWSYGHSLYALGCVASRSGQIKRADYIERAVEGGQSILYMMKDPDLKNIWEHPRFIALQGRIKVDIEF